MTKPVPRSAPFSKIPSRRDLRLMAEASDALLTGRRPNLTADELAEAGRLLEALDQPIDDPLALPEDDEEHEEGCPCHRCDDEPAYHADDLYDMARDLQMDRRVA